MRALLKRLLSPHVISRIQRIRARVDRLLLGLCARHRWLSSFYYSLFSRKFDREHHAVLQGRLAYWQSQTLPASSHVQLRRNIHRLEKGMIMRPRRSVFAEAYIAQTVERYVDCVNAGTLNAGEQRWAQDVLTQYFALVEETVTIQAAKQQFASLSNQPVSAGKPSVPYAHQMIAKSPIDFDAFSQLCRQRRSVRWYQDKPVPKALLELAMTAATQAPSACNRQPFSFYTITDPVLARQVGKIPMGTSGFVDNFQCLVVVVGELAAYPYERDRHVIYIDASLAAMQFMLALETLGLSSCVINWPDLEVLEQKMAKALALQIHQRPVMVISVGFADEDGLIPFSQKKTAQELMKEVTP